MSLLSSVFLLISINNIIGLFNYFTVSVIILSVIILSFILYVLKNLGQPFLANLINNPIIYIIFAIIGYFNNVLLFLICLFVLIKYMFSVIYGDDIYLLPKKRVHLNYKFQPLIKGSLFIFLLINMVLSFYYLNKLESISLLQLVINYVFILLFSLYCSFVGLVIKNTDRFKKIYTFLTTSRDEKEKQNKFKVLLSELSILWENKIIKLEDLSQIWLADDNPKEKDIDFQFKNSEIIYFYTTTLQGIIIDKSVRHVIGYILKYLDDNSDVPSVVQDQNKFYKFAHLKENETYNILYQISLLHHTLGVANNVLKEKHLQHSFGKLLLAALGHDLGKIIGHKDIKNYKTGNHPQSSVYILHNFIQGYKELTIEKEVSQIILNHHSNTGSKDPLIKEFKNIDQKTRREEIENYINKENNSILSQVSQNTNTNTNTEIKTQTENKEIPKNETIENNDEHIIKIIDEKETKPKEQSKYVLPMVQKNEVVKSTQLYGDYDIVNSETPDIINIDWFNIDLFINEIHKKINIVDRTGWIKAITVNNTLVLVLTSLAWDLAYQQAINKEITEIIDIYNNLSIPEEKKQFKKSVLMSIVELLDENNMIDRSWIKKGFFNGLFTIVNEVDSDKNMTGWYIPLKFKTFEEFNSYSSYEELKKGDMINFKTAIVGKSDKEE